LIGLPFLSGGAALVIYIVAGASLPVGIVAVLIVTGAVVLLVWRRLPRHEARAMRARAARGVAAGLAATLAYDGCRLAVVSAFGLSFWPFDTFVRFGRLLVGNGAPPALAIAVGTAYHYANGLGFAVAYVLFVRRPGILSGVLWAALLESVMVSLYPGWLGLRVLDEFLGVSAVGHLAYGIVLGAVARRLVAVPAGRRGGDDISKPELMA
jgi:hypothetical protein